MEGYIVKENPLQRKPSFAIKSDKKALLTPKGDHIPKEDRGEGTRWKPHTRTRSREEEPRAKEQDRPMRRRDSHPDQRMPKYTASAWCRGPRMKANSQTHQKEGKQTSLLRTEEEHRPDLRQVTPSWRPGTPQDQGIQRHCSATRASRQVPDQEPGEQSPLPSYGGWTTKDQP